jgi:LemA protein
MIYIIIPLLLLLLIAVGLFNSLVRKKNDVENAFASVDVMLKKRYDLIPALVETVKGYMKHERRVLAEITALRTRIVNDNLSSEERVLLENRILQGISNIMVAVENYPALKAGENFLNLQASLNEVEEQLAASRRAFNAAVTIFNNSVETFPSNIMASVMNYTRKSLFNIPDNEKEVTDISKQMNN